MNAILALVGLFFSFFFAGSESAFTRFNKVRLEVWFRRKIPLSKNAHYFVKNPDHFFSTILIGNNLANTLCTTFATIIFIQYMGESVIFLLIGFLILLFGEIVPKSLFRSLADQIILYVLIVVRGFYVLLAPLIRVINVLIESILSLFKIRHESMNTYFSREEIHLLLTDQFSDLQEQNNQYQYIDKILTFSSAQVREVMTPRTEMVSLDINSDIDTIIQTMQDSNDPFIIIYNNDLDNIEGAVFLYDLFMVEKSLSDIIKPLVIVPENKLCIDTFSEFKENNISVALVVDEYGGTAGNVTMDNLIEEILGEFLEPQEIPLEIRKLNRNTWLVDAQIDIELINRETGLNIPSGEYESIAGFVLDQTGKIQNKGEIIDFKEFRIKIIDASMQRIQKVQIIRNLI